MMPAVSLDAGIAPPVGMKAEGTRSGRRAVILGHVVVVEEPAEHRLAPDLAGRCGCVWIIIA